MSRRRKKGGGGHGEGGDERWLLTYADMITLLLALFIVLFAMSTIDVVRFDSLKRTLSQTFRGAVLQDPGKPLPGSQSIMDGSNNQKAQTAVFDQMQQANAHTTSQLEREAKALKKVVDSAKVPGAKVATTERGIVVRLAGDTYFQSGSAQLNPSLLEPLRKLSKVLAGEHRPLSIEGHTDGQPIATAEFPSNLRLSTRRAESVYDFLASQGIAMHDMRAVGYADARPLVQPTFPHQGIAENRRVEIVVMAPGADLRSDDGSSTRTPGKATTTPGSIAAAGGSAAPNSPTPIAPVGNSSIIGPIIDLSKG